MLFCIQKENVELSDLSSNMTKRVQCKEWLHEYLNELKCTSDTLFKALLNQEMKSKDFEANVKQLEHTSSNKEEASTG